MSKRSNACKIPLKVRKAVYERDNHKCIICGKFVPVTCSNSHYIKRSQGGLGIEQNVVTLCMNCHYEYDFGKNTKDYEGFVRNYLKKIYGPSWKKEDLIYNKWR